LGQGLLIAGEQTWQVTAVFEDIPVANHFHTHLLLSLNGNDEIKSDPPQ